MESRQEEPKLFITTEEILNATLQYLAQRPYVEVQQLIEALRHSKPAPPQPHNPIPQEIPQTEENIAMMEVVEPTIIKTKAKK